MARRSGFGSSLSLSASNAVMDWQLLGDTMAQRIPDAASIIGSESSPPSLRPPLQRGGEKQHATASSCVNIFYVL
ncbi:Os04g0127001 [Oryza sativa Japonica Group]|uniref:Os04g0127001 protein n=2 Tax=Oryza sativa subsp. japonica TaxID=39947 RepID=C7J1J0_ORYSJ|nr:Os04g0126950 [Oryza sativa Japonica Group]BAS87677.1 Os04g0127001 [Oryza sativa Japonica Group]|eukprot:NP_001173743.1 Os04g0126950 [Oryza sativa Japonica Group]